MMNWLFTDMDSFFASVEQYLRPPLRQREVGVVPVATDNTCIIAASYGAKRRGVKVGTGVRDARRMCPGIALVKARPHLYVETHHRILESVDRCAPVERVYSIDEWSIRLRGEERKPEAAESLGRAIKRQILEDFGPWMTCSIGIAASHLLAKIASDLEKPNGLTILPTEELPGRIEHLSLGKLCGISGGMLARLNSHGIGTVRDLWEIGRNQAVRIWGSVSGARWWAGFHGIDEAEIPTRRRSMSHSNVLDPSYRNPDGARGILIRLTCKLGQRLRRDGYLAKGLSLTIYGRQREKFARKIELPCANDTPTLLHQFDKLWSQCPPEFPFLKVGVAVSGLTRTSQIPRSLFADDHKRQRVSHTVDRINQRCGPMSVYFGALHDFRHSMDNKIAFGRIPDDAEGL